jgi:hypothetical protein
MVRSSMVECSFLMPVHRDANLSDGRQHSYEVWEWLDDKLFEVFGGRTHTRVSTKTRIPARS